MLVSAHRLFHPDSNSRTLLLSIADATERRQREEEKDLLLGELRHRLLGLVQAMARQTAAEGRSGEEYRDAFLGRFNALSGLFGKPRAGLRELVERTLEPYSADSKASSSPVRSCRSRWGKSCRSARFCTNLRPIQSNMAPPGSLHARQSTRDTSNQRGSLAAG
jgi:hypothetical protein